MTLVDPPSAQGADGHHDASAAGASGPGVTWLTVPASADRANEDALWIGDGVVVVVDGAGLPRRWRAGCEHPVAWFARSVADDLGRRLVDRGTPVREALRATIEAVAGAHGPGCDLTAGSPSATVAAWRTDGSEVEVLVLCDSSIILVRDEEIEHLTDTRLDEVVEPLVAAQLAVDAASGAEPSGARRAEHQRAGLEATRNRPGGFWCVHTDPAAADEAVVRRLHRDHVSHVIAASDGATRAFLDLGTHTLRTFVEACRAGELEPLAHAVRRAEIRHTRRLRERGSKIHDDLTLAVTDLHRAAF